MKLRTQIGLAVALAVGLGAGRDAVEAAPTGGVVVIEHLDPAVAPTKGPTGALVTVEVFFAPQVNLGARLPAYRTLERLAAKHPTRVRIVYRILLRNGAGPLLPVAALEAHAQGLFFEFMEKLHVIRTNLSRDQVLDVGKQIGMDVSRLDAVLPAKPGVEFKGSRYSDIIDDNEHRFDRLHGNNAPNVLFNSRPPRSGSVGSLGDNDMEREYNDAYERALEMLDRGVDRRALAQAFDDAALRAVQPLVINAASSDDVNGDPTDHPLAKPPIDLKGLPSYGKPGPHAAPVPVVVLCRPNDAGCNNVLRTLVGLQAMYNDDVRIVWAPFFDVTRDDAAELTMLGDAVLCAEQAGSSPEDMAASPGWRWITKQLTHLSNAHGRRVPAEKLIDAVSTEIDVDPARMAACRARMANTTLEIVDRARKSGIAHGPALVIGGRIYESLTDRPVIQQLIEAEIAPGVLGEVAPAWRPLRK